MRMIAIALLCAACGGHAPPPQAPPAVVAGPPVAAGPTCGSVQPKLDQLYRAEATAAEPKRIDERTADNVEMMMKECAARPAEVIACVTAAATLKDIESKCSAPIDDEGTEGDRLAGARQ